MPYETKVVPLKQHLLKKFFAIVMFFFFHLAGLDAYVVTREILLSMLSTFFFLFRCLVYLGNSAIIFDNFQP